MSLRRLLVPALAAALLAPAAAHASSTQESIFQDDSLIVYGSSAGVTRTLDTLQSLGVERIRVSLYWSLIAPSPTSSTRPSFDAGDSGAYPAGAWQRYDTILQLAAQRGIEVNFNLSPPVPRWAGTPSQNANYDGHYHPSAAEFAQFVHAAGIRYGGGYVPPSPAASATGGTPPPSSSPPSQGGGLPLPLGVNPPGGTPAPAAASAAAAADPLPRVSFWSIWNEPNEFHFLAPQWGVANGRVIEPAAAIYRSLADAAFSGLAGSGHADDTVLIGETAPKGQASPGGTHSLKPLRFLRSLYCLSSSMRPLEGDAARALGCPTSDQRHAFPAQHPGLFAATGWGHHPYSLVTPPTLRSRNRDDLGFADLPRLTATLRAVFGIYGAPRGGLPIYLTEFGYQTNPPDPFGFPPAAQAAYLNQSEYIAYGNPQVRSYAQFLLVDDGPDRRFAPSSPLYWSTFQTGLVGLDGTPKPGFGAYRLPIFLPVTSRRRPGMLRVWGDLRPAPDGSTQTAAVQFRPNGRRKRYATIVRLTTTNYRNYIDGRVRFVRSGTVRLAWPASGGNVLYSREVAIRIRPR